MRVLIIDNYDSFTYNLFHYLKGFTEHVDVRLNDAIELHEIEPYSHLVISPGPGLPSEAGITEAVISNYHQIKSILGVCLGFQALSEFFGASLYNQNFVAHGIQDEVVRSDDNSWLLNDIPLSFKAGLYHSWAVNESEMSPDLRIIARSENGVLMGVEHKHLPLAGVQFHPESIMTEYGTTLIKNWIER